MPEFKRGDRVVCVTVPPKGNLTEGKTYEVLYSRRADRPTLINDMGNAVRYDCDLFVPASMRADA